MSENLKSTKKPGRLPIFTISLHLMLAMCLSSLPFVFPEMAFITLLGGWTIPAAVFVDCYGMVRRREWMSLNHDLSSRSTQLFAGRPLPDGASPS